MAAPPPGGCLRLACLGDSWVASWLETAEGWEVNAAMPTALCAGLERQGFSLELVVAGFPGGTSERLLELARLCRLREMAPLSRRGRSIKGNVSATLAEQGLPLLHASGAAEDIDVVLIAVGSNDLTTKLLSADVVGRLFELQRLYAERGVKVVIVSVGGVGPGEGGEWAELEANRACVNARLLLEDCSLNFDELVGRLEPSMWADGWHLTKEGSAAYGELLAAALAARLAAPALQTPPRPLGCKEGDLLQLSGCSDPAVARIVEGPYLLQGVNHGRPVYRRLGPVGAPSALLFFWDQRNGPLWAGWWLGPEIGWDHPGWARHEDAAALGPPERGWRVPARGGPDEGLRVEVSRGEALWQARPSPWGGPPLVLHAGGGRCRAAAVVAQGSYHMDGTNHGRPMYRRPAAPGGRPGVLFFWDERDGQRYAGWWLGPELGWDHPGWARHEDRNSASPPATGWRLPACGHVDETFMVSSDAPMPPAEAAEEEPPRPLPVPPAPRLRLGVCQSHAASAVLGGAYRADGANHGRPVYRKEGAAAGGEVVIFFWDDRDGPGWVGWWIGPEIGWDHPGWARHEDGAAAAPPLAGWRVPADGPVEESLQLRYGEA